MPYIPEDKRLAMDLVVESMVDAGVEANGDLNYILYKFAKYHVEAGYGNYKNFLGELNEAAEEIRRRLLVPYEDEKITENGDI